MIPEDLKARELALPQSDDHPIVVITGNELRHDRFSLRIQQEFGESVVAWLQVPPSSGSVQTKSTTRHLSLLQSVVRDPRKLAGMVDVSLHRYSRTSQREVERLLFEKEVKRLSRNAHLKPTPVQDPNSSELVEWVQSLQPYFMLTLGGAIYNKALRDCVSGIALNQHDGWCPEYKGSLTVDWALYHRDISHLGNTIHILTGEMDAGPILRRSTACLIPSDTPESCFARSVALGTELMCEAVHEIIETNKIMVYDQPPESGYTYLVHHLNGQVKQSINRDFHAGWLSSELARLRVF